MAVGDAVAAMADLNGDGGWGATGGSNGEGGYAVAREFLTVRKPPSLSFRDAAVLPMAFLSAFTGLYGAVQAGDAVDAMADLNGNGGWVATERSGAEGGYAVARQFLTVRKPESLSFRDAAVLPMCFLSAFCSLYGTVKAGDVVYIPGGGGGIGHLAVQMAARVLGAGLVISSGGTLGKVAVIVGRDPMDGT